MSDVALRQFLQSTAALIAIANPLAAVPAFLSLVRGADVIERRRAARHVALAVLMILAGAAVLGRYLLLVFGISFPAFRVGGGIVVTLMGLHMLQGSPTPVQSDTAGVRDEDQLLVPLAMPLIAGPGSITTVMTLAAGPVATPPAVIVLAVAVTAVFVWVTLALAGRLQSRIGARGQAIITRFMGLVLVAVGAQLVLTGVREFFQP